IAFGSFFQPPRPAMNALPLPPAQAEVAPASPTVATAAAPGATAPPAAAAPLTAPVKWKVLPGSALNFATAWSGDAIRGRFDKWTADILFSPDALPGSKVSVAIDMASVKTGDEQRDASLPSGDFFDVAQHPKATFTAAKFEKTGEGRFVAHGTLSLRGVSKPMNLP